MTMLVLPFAARFSKLLFPLSLPSPMETQSTPSHHQNVVVMRHGDRLDNMQKGWVKQSSRPWDPPLHDSGVTRALRTGRSLRNDLGFPIHRIFVSPFLRCVQTAVGAISGLSTGDEEIDSAIVRKVSIEYGLCEMLNEIAIRSPPKGWEFGINVADLEAKFPSGTVDRSVEPVYKEMPKFPEKVEGARDRYAQVFKALADKFPNENLLLVTHGEAIGVAAAEFMKETVTVYDVQYCAYVVLKRRVFYGGEGEKDSTCFGEFEVQTHDGVMFMKQ